MPDTEINISRQSNTGTACDESMLKLLNALKVDNLTNNNIESVLIDVTRVIANYFGADHTYFMLKDNQGSLEKIAGVHRSEQDDSLVTASDNVTAKVIETGEGVIVENAMDSKQFPGDPTFQRFNINSVICVPIKTTESVFGLIYADSAAVEDKWNRGQLELLEFIGHHIALAVHQVKSEQSNKRLIAVGA